MSWELFHWITLIVLWACIIQNVRIMRRRQRWLQKMRLEPLVEITGLTPLQVQVAMDAAMAQFKQRCEEMRQPHDH